MRFHDAVDVAIGRSTRLANLARESAARIQAQRSGGSGPVPSKTSCMSRMIDLLLWSLGKHHSPVSGATTAVGL